MTDILFRNAQVLTQDPDAACASAVALTGGGITAVGDDLDHLIGPETEVIDAEGAALLPGFVEAHMHLFPGGAELGQLHLGKVSGEAAMAAALQRYAAENADADLLIVKGVDYQILGAERLSAQALDRMLPDRAVLCFNADHHTAWANSLALDQAGLLQGRDLPEGNEVVMAPDGRAQGELREKLAYGPVLALRSTGGREMLGLEAREPEAPPTPVQRAEDIETLKAGLRHCAAHGITAIHNMDGNRYTLELMAEIEAAGDLICRVSVPYHLTSDAPLSALEEAARWQAEFGSDLISADRVKIFVDGVIEGHTAFLLEDYADRPGHRGTPLFSPEAFAQAACEIDRRGMQITVHAVGDAAVRLTLDGYAAARAQNGRRDSRHRIEHIELIHPDDLPRFAQLGVIASPQPPHPPGVMGFPLEPSLSAIGPGRLPYAFAWRRLREAGAHVCFSSDWPVAEVSPLLGIQAAIGRRPWGDEPDQSATLDEALAGYTRDAAYAGFQEDRLGTIRPGMAADLVLLSGPLTAALAELRPALTLCNGRVTYRAN